MDEQRHTRIRITANYTEYPDSDDESFERNLHYLKTFDENEMGKGVKTTAFIGKSTLLGEYEGLRLSYQEAESKMENSDVHYIVGTSLHNRFIDGEGIEGNILKYINHKCEEYNCELVKLTSGRVGIQTIRDIYPGESLNYNYNMIYFPEFKKKVIKCKCTTSCSNYF
jgi:SET domain-containing protein